MEHENDKVETDEEKTEQEERKPIKLGKKAKQEEIEKERDEWKDKYLRLAAEFDNFKKRTERERQEVYTIAKVETIENFLNIVDSLDLALKATPDDEGLKAIKNQIDATFEKLGITETINEKFSPLEHNAIQHETDESKGDGEIVEVFQKGYKIGDRIIRHSVVKTVN